MNIYPSGGHGGYTTMDPSEPNDKRTLEERYQEGKAFCDAHNKEVSKRIAAEKRKKK